MDLKTLLSERKMSMYRLSQISGVPKTTVIDICTGKSAIEGCTAKTVMLLAKALDCTMEELMGMDHTREKKTVVSEGSYLEKGLPPYLLASIKAMKQSWERKDQGEEDPRWDLYWCDLNADINSAETEQEISSEQAWYLRRKYLRMEKE